MLKQNDMEVKTLDLENAARAAKARYQREWNKKNRDKVKVYNMRYWARKAAAFSASEQEDNGNNGRKDAD